ncbi:hypothetical protein [Streptomyces resistomycificus]|uniref:hypothetical protein n=1 Tax=Streptomyces resistomycificus TaxID=67356 RepID=UPI0004AB90B8|nr:hypothetical protein [Streptomyces resistomycificus]
MGGDRVLVRGREEQQQAGVVGQRLDLRAMCAQQGGRQFGRFGGQRVKTCLLFRMCIRDRQQFGGGTGIAVHGTQHADADAFGSSGAAGLHVSVRRGGEVRSRGWGFTGVTTQMTLLAS